MNSAFQRIKSDPNLLIPYVLASLSGGVLIMLILWRALSADAGVPPPLALTLNGAPTAIVRPTRTPVILPTPTPEQLLPSPFLPTDPLLLPPPDIGTAVPLDQGGTGLSTGPTPDINNDEDYSNRVALPAPNNPDTNLQQLAPLATAQVDTGNSPQTGTQPGSPLGNPTQEPLAPGGSTGLAPLPTPDIGNQGEVTSTPTPVDATQPDPEPTAVPIVVPSPDVNTPEPTPTPFGGSSPPPTLVPTATPQPQSAIPFIPVLEEVIFLQSTSDLVSNTLNAGDPMPVDFNAAAGVTPGTLRIIAEAFLVEDARLSMFNYQGSLRTAGWQLLADTGELGPLVYNQGEFIFVLAGLEPNQMAELGEDRGPGIIMVLYDPS
jgi:hypothetical protein